MRLKPGSRVAIRGTVNPPVKKTSPNRNWFAFPIFASVLTASIVVPICYPPAITPEVERLPVNISITEPINGAALERDSVQVIATVETEAIDQMAVLSVRDRQHEIVLERGGEVSHDWNSLAHGLNILQVDVVGQMDFTGVIVPRASFHFDESTEGWTISGVDEQMRRAPVWLEHQDHHSTGQSLIARSGLDIVFAFDVSASMEPHLEEAENFCKQLLVNLKRKHCVVRTVFVQFADKVSTDRFSSWRTDSESFPDFTVINGSPDLKEAHYVAIDHALSFLEQESDQDHRRGIVLISDAQPSLSLDQDAILAEIEDAKKENIRIFPVVIRPDKTEVEREKSEYFENVDEEARVLTKAVEGRQQPQWEIFEEANAFADGIAKATGGAATVLETITWFDIDRKEKNEDWILANENLEHQLNQKAERLAQFLVQAKEHWTWHFPKRDLATLRQASGEYLHFSLHGLSDRRVQVVLSSGDANRIAHCNPVSTNGGWNHFVIRLDESFGVETDSSGIDFATLISNATDLGIKCEVTDETSSMGLDRVILTMASRITKPKQSEESP